MGWAYGAMNPVLIPEDLEPAQESGDQFTASCPVAASTQGRFVSAGYRMWRDSGRLIVADSKTQDRSTLHNPLLCIGYCEPNTFQSDYHIFSNLPVRTFRIHFPPYC
jgi:hypothetical protein